MFKDKNTKRQYLKISKISNFSWIHLKDSKVIYK